MNNKELENNAIHFFENVGFRVIYAQQDNVYILHPNDAAEAVKCGSAIFAPRAMEAIGTILSGM